MMKIFWAVRRQDQTREFRDKELLAAQRLGFTEELWDHGQSKKTPSFQLGLLLYRRNKGRSSGSGHRTLTGSDVGA